ncbi:hypothetical protein AaE_012130 [Aphanomyces astaci]|uniref:Uncharacterized protein n=1 Tax=Aphanomyces astaci TaxID=112090 RepID=A0A6A4Z9X1_APHAT|nr:hypothetical protein AaE_012130 [Aphanomyces astaci]
MSSSLWKSADAVEWRAMYDTYDNVRESLEDKLEALETWFHAELPPLVRAQGYITQPQLSKLMQWKLSKGKWCATATPKFCGCADQQTSDRPVNESICCVYEKVVSRGYCGPVRTQGRRSRHGFRSSRRLRSSCSVHGRRSSQRIDQCDIITITIIVIYMVQSWIHSPLYSSCLGEIGARQYTLPHFVRFLDTVQAKASALNESITDDGGHVWTAQQVQLCLWLEQAAQSSGSTTPKAKPPTKKRPKRSASSELQLPANKRTTRGSSTR